MGQEVRGAQEEVIDCSFSDIKWDEYAQTHVHDAESYFNESPQRERVERMADRLGPPEWTVLDVGASDGFTSHIFQKCGHKVTACDISVTRVQRIREQYPEVDAVLCPGETLPFSDGSFDVVVLGEILEHCPNPGLLFAEACRVAYERVVISVPLNGWADPTHEWRISIETLGAQNPFNPTKGQQAVMTWQKGRCWGPQEQGYFIGDQRWQMQFVDEPVPKVRIQ